MLLGFSCFERQGSAEDASLRAWGCCGLSRGVINNEQRRIGVELTSAGLTCGAEGPGRAVRGALVGAGRATIHVDANDDVCKGEGRRQMVWGR